MKAEMIWSRKRILFQKKQEKQPQQIQICRSDLNIAWQKGKKEKVDPCRLLGLGKMNNFLDKMF